MLNISRSGLEISYAKSSLTSLLSDSAISVATLLRKGVARSKIASRASRKVLAASLSLGGEPEPAFPPRLEPVEERLP